MGSDDEVSMLTGRERNAHRWWQATLRAPLVEDLSDSADVNGVALENFNQRIFQIRDGIIQLMGEYRCEWRRRYDGQ